jgi:hypothetical protein
VHPLAIHRSCQLRTPEGGKFTLETTIPKGTIVRIEIPGNFAKLGEGSESKAPKALGMQDKRPVFKVLPGTYSFTSDLLKP